MSNFQAGDVVRLKSGGPKMTVSHSLDAKGYWCEWFLDGEAKPHGHAFRPEMLEKVPTKG